MKYGTEIQRMTNSALVTSVAAIIVALFTTVTPVQAQGTPDGETPANEAVCDSLVGGTPGLYGLCVAYCEAQDLDAFEKNPPSTQILANYRKMMKDGDPDMPCVQNPCPCWTESEIQSIDGSMGTVSCSISDTWAHIDESNTTNFQYAAVGEDEASLTCEYFDDSVSPVVERYMSVSPEHAAVCRAQIVARCNDLGL